MSSLLRNLRVAVVGAGRIGAMVDDRESALILSHAHGYTACGGFDVVGFVDSEIEKAEAAANRWGGSAFSSMERLLEVEAVDVISICLPDEEHYPALLALANKHIELIFLEKPAVRTVAEADAVRTLYSGLSTRVQVNYTRRFVPEIRGVRKCIRRGDYGKFLSGIGYYGKGLLHNGSHLVDLLHFLLGAIGDVRKTGEIEDFYKDDPSVSALLTMSCGGAFHLVSIDCREFHVFELDLTFEKRRIRISELGTLIEEYAVGESRLFEGYRTLNKEKEYATQHCKAMLYAVENIRENLYGNEALLCPLDESLEAVTTCSRIARSLPI